MGIEAVLGRATPIGDGVRVSHGKSEYTCPACGAVELRAGRYVAVPDASRLYKGQEERLPETCWCGGVMEWKPTTSTTFTDEIPGGVTLENYGAQPVTFYSHSERRRYMEANGLQEREKFTPFPGTDRDPMGIQRPEGYIDTVTMENRRVLALRAAGCKTDDSIEGVIGDTYSGVITERDAKAVWSGNVARQSRLGRRLHGNRSGS